MPRRPDLHQALIPTLARALIAGEQTPDATHARLVETLGRAWRFLPPLTRRYHAHFSLGPRPRLREAIAFLRNDRRFLRACESHHKSLRLAQWTTESAQMSPLPIARDWPVRPVATTAALANLLALTPEELAWFADSRHLNCRAAAPKLHHYHYKVLPKSSGLPRLIEVPKPNLKAIQRIVLREILDHIPAHPAAHGFRRRRSAVTFAAPHTAQAAVLRLDIQNFFPTFTAARVNALFRTAGYPDAVAARLTGLCTNIAPRGLWNPTPTLPRDQIRNAQELYSRPHLPQGAPTSPALANALAYRLDLRLAGLAQSAGATYTRYADDLAFSGPPAFAHAAERFGLHVAAILLEEGFHANHRKTRLMRAATRQHLAGVVINAHPNLRRSDYDILKATLNNCVRRGPESQNRGNHPDFRRHLEGCIAYVAMLNRARAVRLRILFDQIQWP